MKNDVFLSFKGDKTGKTFVSHLLSSLKKKDITTSASSESCPVSLQALQESLVAIVIISDEHMSLGLWVDDLATIIECEEKGTLTVVPVFFQHNPHDFLQMLGRKDAQSMHEPQRKSLEIVKKWLDTHIINKSGFNSFDCKDDSELVGKVTNFVSDILTSSTSRCQTSSTGLSPDRTLKLAFRSDLSVPLTRDDADFKRSSCVEDLRALTLRAKSTIIGVCGVEGVGKTSLVRYVYDDISPQFQHYFFFRNRIPTQDMISYKPNSLLTDLAREVLKRSNFHGRSIDAIKDMIRHRKVLLVADRVDDIKQLKGIIKEASWFGPGSRVIVITKDRSLLTQCGVKHIYELECPKFEEALALFSEYAFKQRNPLPGYEDLSFLAVQVSNRLPLTLKMLGTFLRNKEKSEWVSTLRRLEVSHNNYATEVCRYVGADKYAPRRPMKVDHHVGVEEANRLPFYHFSLK